MALSCFACAAYRPSARNSAKPSRINAAAELDRRANPTRMPHQLIVLASACLAFNPAAAFNPCNLGAYVVTGNPIRAGLLNAQNRHYYQDASNPWMNAGNEMLDLRRKQILECKDETNSVKLPKKALFTRGQLVALLAAAGFSRKPSFAARGSGVQWTFSLPEGFDVERQLSSIVRIQTETMLLAEDKKSGAQIKLLLLPFGKQAGASLDADEQLTIAKLFFDGKVDAAGAETVANTMAASAARSPSVSGLMRAGNAEVFSADGRQYVRYSYTSDKCLGLIEDGECSSKRQKRRSLATITVSSIGQFRTNSERDQMREEGVTRNVQVLWLMTISAPEGAKWKSLEPTLQQASASFRVPVVDNIL